MSQLGITLYSNRTHHLDNPENAIIVAGENKATTINVTFPIEYESYSKRVDLINIKGEKWTEPLYMPEDNRNSYDPTFNKNNFAYKLPDAITIEGEMLMQFIAYKPDTDIFVPFEMVKLTVKGSVNCCRNAKRNPDLIVKAYEYSNKALGTVQETKSKIIIIENKTAELESSIQGFSKELEDALANIGSGGGSENTGGLMELPTDQGESNFLAGDGVYKKIKEMEDDSGNSSIKVGIGNTSDILIKRINGNIEQSVYATGSQMELKTINTNANRFATIQLYATGMMKFKVSSGTTTDTLEIINGTLRFNNKKVLTEE